MKRRIRLTESELHNLIKESVIQILRENENIPQYISLKTGIGYDSDDYGVYSNILYDTRTKSVRYIYYGHGEGPSITGECDIYDAINNGLCNENDVKNAIINLLSYNIDISADKIKDLVLKSLKDVKLSIPCMVSRSRNIKGKCILLGVIEKLNNYRPYYGRTFDSKYDTYFKVYSELTNTVAEVGFNTVSFSNDVIENIKNETINVLMNMKLLDLIYLCVYNISRSRIDKEILQDNIIKVYKTAIQNLYGKNYIIPDNVNNPQQAKRDEKNKAFKEIKMPELIEWARSVHPDWDDEEINQLAEKVWNKRYANR